jgi:hypothetical protein
VPGQNRPLRYHPIDTWRGNEAAIQALATQQYDVTTDPTGSTGDPNHGHATFVTGYLGIICGINAYGAAVWHGGTSSWTQIAPA